MFSSSENTPSHFKTTRESFVCVFFFHLHNAILHFPKPELIPGLISMLIFVPSSGLTSCNIWNKSPKTLPTWLKILGELVIPAEVLSNQLRPSHQVFSTLPGVEQKAGSRQPPFLYKDAQPAAEGLAPKSKSSHPGCKDIPPSRH